MQHKTNNITFGFVCTKKLPLQRGFTPADYTIGTWEPP